MFNGAGNWDGLQRVPLFSGIRERELKAIGSLMTEMVFPEGRTLIEENRWGLEFFILTSGTVEVTRDGELIAHLGAGEFFGEMALLDGRPRSATVTAATQVTAYVLGAREFASLVHGHSVVARNLLRRMSERLRTAA